VRGSLLPITSTMPVNIVNRLFQFGFSEELAITRDEIERRWIDLKVGEW